MKKLKQLFAITLLVFAGTSAWAQTISNEAAQEMIEAYKNTKPLTFGHLYTSNVLRSLIEPSYVKSVYIFKGLDGEKNEHIIFKRALDDGKIIDQTYAVNDGDPCPYSDPKHCPPNDPPPFNRNIGKQINETVAQEMIASYQASTDRNVAVFPKASIQKMLAANDIKGVYFVNVVDNANIVSLIAIGFNSKGELMTDGLIIKATIVEMDYPLLSSSIKK